MANENCLAGIVCPACGSDGTFNIVVSALATVTDDGTDDMRDIDWDEDSYISCMACHHTGTVREFQVKDASTEEQVPERPLCELCEGTGTEKVAWCTCGGVDIGVGTKHFPDCGLEQCPACGGSGYREGELMGSGLGNTHRIAALATLAELAKQRVYSSQLDELIHQLKSSEASTINNGGLESQVVYVYTEMGDAAHKAIMEALE